MYELVATCLDRLHLAKVPSINQGFFAYCHFNDANSRGPILSVYFNHNEQKVRLFINGLTKLKPNTQQSPRTRIDIYMSVETGCEISRHIQEICNNLNINGVALGQANVNPEAARMGPQALPIIQQQYTIDILNAYGYCAGYNFGGATRMYFDHERPNDNHIEMIGEERHLGIPLSNINGLEDATSIQLHNVPNSELRVGGEENPVKFAELKIYIEMTIGQACNFARTIQQA